MIIADLAVVAVVLLAALIAFYLGFVRVVLALAGWVGAAFATLHGFSYVRPIARDWISIGIVADATTGIVLFLISLVVLTMISHAIGRRIRASGLSALDRSLGLVFGLVLGGAMVSLAYLGLAWAIDDLPNNQPDWLRTARTRPVVEWGAERLGVLVPPQWRGAIPATGGPRSSDPSKDAERALRKLIAPDVKHAAPDTKSGYDVKERREMDRLIQSHQ